MKIHLIQFSLDNRLVSNCDVRSFFSPFTTLLGEYQIKKPIVTNERKHKLSFS